MRAWLRTALLCLALTWTPSLLGAELPLDITPWSYGYQAHCTNSSSSSGFTSDGAAAASGYAAILELSPGRCSYVLHSNNGWPAQGDGQFAECGSTTGVPLISPQGIETYNVRAVTYDLYGSPPAVDCNFITGNSTYWVRRARTANCSTGSTPTQSSTCEQSGSNLDKQDPCASGCNGTDPIDSKLRIEFTSEVDFESPTSLFEMKRYYMGRNAWTEGVLGPNWRHGYERRVYETSSGGLTATAVIRPDGKKFFFRHLTGGVLQSDPDVVVRLLRGQSATDSTGWRVIDERDVVERYDAQGSWVGSEAPSGKTLTASYVNGELDAITEETGRKYLFQYGNLSGKHRLTAVVLPSGKRIRYGYLTALTQVPLEKVYFPSGDPSTESDDHFKRYTYSALRLSGSYDERGQRATTINYDAWDNAIQSYEGDASLYANRVDVNDLGDGRTEIVRFISPPVGSAPAQSIKPKYSFTLIHGVYRFASMDQPCPDCGNLANVMSRSYDQNGFVNEEVDRRGFITDYDHNTRGLVTRRIDAAGIAPIANENLPERRTTESDWHPGFRAPVERRVKDASNNLSSLVRWAYNTRGQVTARCEVDVGASAEATAARNYACGSSADAPARVRQTQYLYCDSVDLRTPDEIGANGENLGKGCPVVGLLRRVDGPRVDVVDFTTVEYRLGDAPGCATTPATCGFRAGDLWRTINALGHASEIVARDAEGRPLQTKDANGTYTDLVYNQRGWLEKRAIRASGAGSPSSSDRVDTFEFDAHGNVTRIIDAAQAFLAFSYDSASRLISISDGTGAHIDFALNSLGKRTIEKTYATSDTSQLRRRLARQFDALGRLRFQRDALVANGSPLSGPAADDPTNGRPVAEYQYLGNGTVPTAEFDALGVKTGYVHDALDRLARIMQDQLGLDPGTSNATAEFGYDADGSLATVTDPKGLDTVYSYDGLGDLVHQSSPDTGDTSYAYDAAGNRISKTDARDITTLYAYDALNRLVSAATPASTTTFAYDEGASCQAASFGIGLLSQMSDSSGTTRYCYDRFGGLTEKGQQVIPWAEIVLSWRYDAAGRVRKIIYDDLGHARRAILVARDTNGRVAGLDEAIDDAIDPCTVNPDLACLPRGGETLQIISDVSYLPFGPVSSITFGRGRVQTRTFDANYRISTIGSAFPPLDLGYTVDPSGDIVGVVDSSAPAESRSYDYDALHRLVEVTSAQGSLVVERFTYDKTGNRLSTLESGVDLPYAYPSTSHWLTSIGGQTRSYDDAGNLIQVGSNLPSYGYDDRGRLVSAVTNLASATYTYNGLGERVAKSVSPGDRVFVYDQDGHLLVEFDPHGRMRGYLWVDDMPVALFDSSGYKYIESDHQNTPRAVIDSTSDAVLWSWPITGSAFGEHSPDNDVDGDSAPFEFNLRFPGQYFDAESGLHYNHYRDYEPSTGRYIESDPIGLGGGASTFAYVSGDPLGSQDVNGLAGQKPKRPGFGSGGNSKDRRKQTRDYMRNPDDPSIPDLSNDETRQNYWQSGTKWNYSHETRQACKVVMCYDQRSPLYCTATDRGWYRKYFVGGTLPTMDEVAANPNCYCADGGLLIDQYSRQPEMADWDDILQAAAKAARNRSRR